MTTATLYVITGFALLLALATVYFYERAMARLRFERDELLDVLDAHVDDLRRQAQQRHPSNVRVLRVVEGG